MAKKKTKTKVKKIKLSDLMGSEGKANADLYKSDPEKRKYHLMNRTIRQQLISPKGSEYQRRLSGSVKNDTKHHELAREFINNGFNQMRAYASVWGVSKAQAGKPASKIFNSVWMRALINSMLRGSDQELADLPKEFLLEKLMQMIESNILDYMDDEGGFLNVRELKALPTWTQQIIKRLNVTSWATPNMVKNEAGVMEQMGEIRHQRVQIELYDRQKALDSLAAAMHWITKNIEIGTVCIGADVMIAANQRVEKLRRSSDIEGTAKKITAN